MKRGFISLAVIFSVIVFSQVAVGEYSQAPVLSNTEGLPSVAERLPDEPFVTEVDEIGNYGGTWRVVQVGAAVGQAIKPLLGEALISWNRTASGVVANVLEKYVSSPCGHIYTLYFRQGMKWSDGHPVTADDFLFWFEDIISNQELVPTFPAWMGSRDSTKVTKIDEYTVEIDFGEPNVFFTNNAAFFGAGANWVNVMMQPKHYLSQFHAAYADEEALEKIVSDKRFDNWYSLFANLADNALNPDLPVISAWHLVELIPGQRYTYERNPYYWKVDPQGNQLPYIDKVVIDVVENAEVAKAKIAAGEVDTDFTTTSLVDYSFLQTYAERGGYEVRLWSSAIGSNLTIWPNLNHDDPMLNELFNDLDFRIALSVGINRDELNELFYFGLAEPRQATATPEAEVFIEELASLHAEFDPQKANALLDALGLDKRGSDGYRLRPDGKRLELTLEYTPNETFGPWGDMLSTIADYWENLGLKTTVISRASSYYYQRANTGDIHFSVWAYGRGSVPLLAPIFVFPSAAAGTANGAHEYAAWFYTDGQSGIKPEGPMLEAMELYREYVVEGDADKRVEIGKQIMRLSAENLWGIGTVGRSPFPVVVSKNMGNVPENVVRDWVLLHYNFTRPEQYFLRQ